MIRLALVLFCALSALTACSPPPIGTDGVLTLLVSGIAEVGAHLGIRLGDDRPWLMAIDDDAVRVYRRG